MLCSQCPPIERMRFNVGPFALRGAPVSPARVPALAPRRLLLDDVLVQAARAAGAEVREGFPVHELTWADDGRVTGGRGSRTLEH